MRELSLFSGGGGGLLATKWLLGWQTIGYVEIDDYCQQIIQQRIRDGLLDEAPIFGDIRAFIDQGYAERYRGMVDVITAGFPCQPFSVAGKRKGKDDKRNMWPQTIECIRMVRPKYAFLENVPGILTSGYFGTVLGDLAESGYDCRWRCLSAAELGAPHQRKRLWIIAYTHQFDDNDGRHDPGAIFGERSQTTDIFDQSKQTGENEQGMGSETRQVSDTTSDRCNSGRHTQRKYGDFLFEEREPTEKKQERENRIDRFSKICHVIPDTESMQRQTIQRLQPDGILSNICNAELPGLEESQGERTDPRQEQPPLKRASWWNVEPGMGRVADGVANRVDRLKAIGNGQVPIVAATAWLLLTEELI